MIKNRIKDIDTFAIVEPRIFQIGRELERLLALVQLEQDGKPVEVSGFRLRDLSKWTDSTIDTAMNALTPISGVCNSKCSFCFEEGIPYPREQSLMTIEEAETRLQYFEPETGRSLFPSNRQHMESFIHPNALEIIEMARKRQPDKLFWITSNGSHFTEPTIERLAALKPLIFKLSLNVADAQLNRELMKTGRRTDIALDAPRLLQKYRLPFMGSIVAWPTQTLEAIEDTVRYLERYQAYAIRIRLPLTHRHLKQQLDADFDAHWRKITEFALRLRDDVSVPLFVEPPIYSVQPIVPQVDGVVLNSPAYHAGVRAGDVVRMINGQTVVTRIQSEAILGQCHVDRAETVDLVVERSGQEEKMVLEEIPSTVDSYPYNSDFFYRGENYGIFHVEDFRLKYIQGVFDEIGKYGAKNVLLFTSTVVAPIFEALVTGVPEFAEQSRDVNIYVETVSDNTLGGNYDIMDSRFVQDYAGVIRRRLAEGAQLDLILIPDAFGSPWGTDLTGASYTEMSMEFGIPVELISWLLVYGREV